MAAVIYDLFPAEVTVTSKSPETGEYIESSAFIMPSARVVVTNEEVLVVIDAPMGPILALQMPYAPGNFDQAPKQSGVSTIETSTGQRLSFRKDESCGCGSRLRGWNPYSHIVARG